MTGGPDPVNVMSDTVAAALRFPRKDIPAILLLGVAAALLGLRADLRLAAVMGLPLLLFGAWWILAAPHRWWISFAAASLLLPPLPLEAGNTGPHVAVAIAAIGVWAGLVRFAEWRFPRYGQSLAAAAILFLSVLLLSVPMAFLYSGWAVAAGSLLRALLFGLAIYTFFAFAYGPTSRETDALAPVRNLYYFGIGAALIACADFYLQLSPPAGFSEQYVWLPEGAMRRAQGFFYEAGMLGNLCAFFLVMLALAVLRPAVRARLLSRKALLAGCALFSAALFFSFSRSSLLNVTVSLAAVGIVHRADLGRYRRRIALTLAAMAAGLLLAAALFPGYAEVYMSRIWHTVFRGFIDPQGLLSGRLQTWRELLDFLSAQPEHLLLGIGFKTLPYSHAAGRPLIADNMYLSILVETGVAGLLAMLLFSGTILQAGFRAMRSPGASASFLGAWIFCFWIGQLFQMLSVDVLTYWRVLPLYFAVLGLAVRESARAPGTAAEES